MAFSRILVATDFSTGSLVAAQQAATLAARDAVFEAFHVLPHQRPKIPSRVLNEDQEQSLQDLWDRRAQVAHEGLAQFVKDADFRGAATRVLYGSIEGAAAKLGESFKPDLIALGACSHDRGPHLTAGSNARALLRGATCSVLVARPYKTTTDGGTPSRVAVATDFLEDSEAACRAAAELAKRKVAARVAHVFDARNWLDEFSTARVRKPPKGLRSLAELQNAYRGYLHQANIKFFRGGAREDFLFGVPGQALVDYLRGQKIDLAVVGGRGEHAMKGVEIGSVAADVAERATCTVLVCRR